MKATTERSNDEYRVTVNDYTENGQIYISVATTKSKLNLEELHEDLRDIINYINKKYEPNQSTNRWSERTASESK